MDAEDLQEIAARDQFWSSLRVLVPEIEQLAAGPLADPERERQLVQLLARVVLAELAYRAGHSEPE
jgi:hypothetical protein